MGLLAYIRMGGAVNWILFAGFLFSAVLVTERLLYFLHTAGERREASQAQRMRRISQGTQGIPEAVRSDILEKHGALLFEEMEKGLWLLQFIGAASPSLGLLGTVLGLIRAFRDMAAAGGGGTVQDFSSGIWVAMLTTACGLIVALPALFFVSYFRRVIAKRSLAMSLAVDEELLEEQGREVVCRGRFS